MKSCLPACATPSVDLSSWEASGTDHSSGSETKARREWSIDRTCSMRMGKIQQLTMEAFSCYLTYTFFFRTWSQTALISCFHISSFSLLLGINECRLLRVKINLLHNFMINERKSMRSRLRTATIFMRSNSPSDKRSSELITRLFDVTEYISICIEYRKQRTNT